nr:pleiotropic drug resistance protein 1 [Quercus suber]
MEGGDIYKASSSSSLRRNNSVEVFSRSSREEDDDEALKWAALERLPTYDRLRKGILTTSKGEANEINIGSLGFEERKQLLERLVKVAEEDNEKFLMKGRNWIDRVGIDLTTIEVRFGNLNVEAEAYVGGRAVPTFFNFSVNIVEGFLDSLYILPSKKKHLSILKDVSGIIKPRRMTLLLGPPSSGKTTLLLALAGKLDPDLKLSGRVTYNGHGMNENPVLLCKVPRVGSSYDMLAELSRREKEANIRPDPDIDIYMMAATTEGQEAAVVTDYTLKVLGLDVSADTMVGDEMIRGISGGQRKCVTTGEMLVGPANALFMDEISTGLDSSTTFQIVNSLKQHVHILDGTAVISLLQPAPETYNLFYDIILLSDGYIVYQSPRELVLDFFQSMGFKCPDRKGVADFLQEVISRKDQKQYWARKDEPYSFVTVQEFVEAFQSFHVGKSIGDELSVPYDKSKSHPAALTTNKYGVNKKELLKMPRDTVTDGRIYTGAMFFTLIMIMFNGMAELSMTIVKLPVFYKQRDLLFYPSWVYALLTWILKIPVTFLEVGVWVFMTYYVIGFDPKLSMTIVKLPVFYKQRDLLFYPSWVYALLTWILKIPVTFLEVGVWVFMTYYVIGFDPSLGRLFKQYLLLLLVNQMASALFRSIGALGRNMIVANTFGSFALLLLFALGGFILSRDDIKKWWIWGYWILPMMYGHNAIVVNEFLGGNWRNGSTMEALGISVLRSPLAYLNPFGKAQIVKSDEPESNEQRQRTGEGIQLTLRGNSSSHHSNIGSRRRSSSFARSGAKIEASCNGKRGMVLPFD